MLLGRQGRREAFKGSLLPMQRRENLQESVRQVAKGHAAGLPKAPGRV